jgi:cytochrome b561
MTVPREGTFATATRIVAGDDRTRYDGVSIALHWLTALLVITQFALALLWDSFGRPAHHLMVVAHMSFGIILTVVIVARIVWRLMPGHQIPSLEAGWVGRAARAVHYLLYVLLAAEAVLGFLTRWWEGREMSFFGLLIPGPFGEGDRAVHHMLMDWHEKIGWAIIIVAIGHAAAALYHHVVLKDRVLKRMLPGSA